MAGTYLGTETSRWTVCTPGTMRAAASTPSTSILCVAVIAHAANADRRAARHGPLPGDVQQPVRSGKE